jgi:hypothetical protein
VRKQPGAQSGLARNAARIRTAAATRHADRIAHRYRVASALFPSYPACQQTGLMILILAYQIAFPILPGGFDITDYCQQALTGDRPMYCPYWAYWVFVPLAAVPFKANYVVLIATLLAGLVAVQRATEGNAWRLLLTMPYVPPYSQLARYLFPMPAW